MGLRRGTGRHQEQRQIWLAAHVFLASLPHGHREVLQDAAAQDGVNPEQLIAGALAEIVERYRATLTITGGESHG